MRSLLLFPSQMADEADRMKPIEGVQKHVLGRDPLPERGSIGRIRLAAKTAAFSGGGPGIEDAAIEAVAQELGVSCDRGRDFIYPKTGNNDVDDLAVIRDVIGTIVGENPGITDDELKAKTLDWLITHSDADFRKAAAVNNGGRFHSNGGKWWPGSR